MGASSSDPYFIIWGETKKEGTLNRVKLAKSEVVEKNRSPQWEPIRWTDTQLGLVKLCDSILIEVYDWDRIGDDDFIGSAQLHLPLLDMPTEIDLHPITIFGRKGKSAGRLEGVVALTHQDSTTVATSFDVENSRSVTSWTRSFDVDEPPSQGSSRPRGSIIV